MAEHDDPLLDCLLFIAKFKERPISSQLLNNAKKGEKLTASELIKVCQKIDLSARIIKRSIDSISNLILPAILILKSNRACVLLKKNNHEKTAEVSFSESGDSIDTIDLSKLEDEYQGTAIFINSAYEFDSRSETEGMISPTLSWFWSTFWRFKNIYFNVFLASIFINLFVLAIPLFIMNVYDRVVPNNAYETLWVLSTGVIIVLIFDLIIKTLRSYFIDVAGKKADIIISSTLLDKSLNTSMEAQPESVGVRANQMKEFEFVREFFSSISVATLIDLPFVLLFIFVIYFIAGSVFLLPLVGLIAIFFIASLLSIPMYSAIRKSFAGSAQKNAVLVESLSAVEDVKSTNSQNAILRKWQSYSAVTAKWLLRARFLSNLVTTITAYGASLVTVGVVIYGVYLIGNGELTIGGLIACTILTGRAMAPLGLLTNLLIRFQQANCSLKSLDQMMKAPVEASETKRFILRDRLKGGIEFKNVCFSYPHQSKMIFNKLNLSIQPEEKVAILGSVGSGKSTLLKLIDGLYSPTKGTIAIDGADIRQIDPSDLRRNIGYLPQEPKLFFGTARSNITIRAPYASNESIAKAAELSRASTFISQHPDGFEMKIGECGKGLSGGQQQTIALARTLLDDPPVILFDEPTSAVDSLIEQQFITNMKEYVRGKTLICVTHKNSILQLVDRIIILQQGQVIMDGPRDQVLNEIKKQTEGSLNG
ncbi:MAG: type I secretion system permease/ATPase [Chlamydiota bacterium]|nr:type I secretion system permease/ATPase [Chlamydiota bacterium]